MGEFDSLFPLPTWQRYDSRQTWAPQPPRISTLRPTSKQLAALVTAAKALFEEKEELIPSKTNEQKEKLRRSC